MSKIKHLITGLSLLFISSSCSTEKEHKEYPNIILIMADDLGWGDVGFNGNELVKTPELDKMAEKGVVFTQFYAAAPVSSPTRGSCLTGRHPYRYGVLHANVGRIKSEEITMAEYLNEKGYKTGHFGKWHLGTLTNEVVDANRGGRDSTHYSPPWDNGYDVCFSTESKVPTWNPMITPSREAGGIGRRTPGTPYGTYYWNGAGEKAMDNLEGDDSRVIMDRVIPFIEEQAINEKPFFATVWFHTPHLPVLTGEKYRDLYETENIDVQHYYGSISAMDEQIGRLNQFLSDLNIDENTLIFFTSDNGPEGNKKNGRNQGSTGGFRGRKRSLYEGGIRVPSIAVWPSMIEGGQKSVFPSVTSDYFPTILEVIGEKNDFPISPIDGVSLVDALKNSSIERSSPIAFQFMNQKALIENRYKLVQYFDEYELYDLLKDPFETTDLSNKMPEKTKEMKYVLNEFVSSCEESQKGMDYSN